MTVAALDDKVINHSLQAERDVVGSREPNYFGGIDDISVTAEVV